jgi:hypothetical protein
MTSNHWSFEVLYVLSSAVVGPVVFKPPLWDEYRIRQVVGFAIGMVTWTAVAANTLLLLL